MLVQRVMGFTFLAGALLLLGCGQRPEGGVTPKVAVVRVTQPVEREVPDYEYVTGRTEAKEAVNVRARVTGYLVSIDFEPGMDVTKDQPLFRIDPRPYKAELDRAKGQIGLAEARSKLAKAEYARGMEISRTAGAISREDLEKFAAAQSEAEATVTAAKASAEIADLNLKFTDILSPIDGVAGRNLLTLGNLVTQDNTLLTTIVSMDPMHAYFDVDERTLLRVQQLIREGKFKSAKEGNAVPVELGLATEGDAYPHRGTIDFVNNQVSAGTGTLQVRGVFPNPKPSTGPRLLTPGLFVRIRLPIGPPTRALVVPQAALGSDQGQKYLLVVNEKNVVEYRPVNTGPLERGGMQAVLPIKRVRTETGFRPPRDGEIGEDSISRNDHIIVSGLQRVRPGDVVDPKPVE